MIVSVVVFMGFLKSDDAEKVSISGLRAVYSTKPQSEWPKPLLHNSINESTFQDIGKMPLVPYPPENAFDEKKVKLGKMLFFDPRLSSSGQIACANCHNPELGWTDNLTRSFGHDRQTGGRNAMTLLNAGFATTLFWDGRAGSLEEQAQFPIKDPLEMNEHLSLAVEKIAKIEGYKKMFKNVFQDTVSLKNIQKAIATFERTIISGPTKFDRFISGDSTLFTDEEVNGLHLFRTKAACINCHNTPYFSDNKFHNDGQTLFGTKNEDFGRYNITKNKEDLGKFRTPTLREVSRTGPWMHHGHFPSLLDVVQFYNLGNPAPVQKQNLGSARDSLIPTPSPILRKLELSKSEEQALVAFLNTLTSRTVRMAMPDLPK